MGAKFLHTHVRTPDAKAVADALRELARARRFTFAEKDEPCDADVVVATERASPEWTSIYGRFDDVSWDLSEILSTDVLVTSIFDGDILEASLYREGAEVDVFCSDREDGRARRARKGQPRRWDSLCVAGRSWRDVQRVFKSANTDPESALLELGRIVGLDARSLYPDHLDPADPSVHRLRLRRPPAPKRRILESTPVIVPPSRAWGGPVTGGEDQTFSAPLDFALGAGARTTGSHAASAGGGANGVEIAIGGTAIREALLVVESVRFRGASAPTGERLESDGLWVVAEFPRAGLPAASGFVNAEDTVLVADHYPSVQIELALAPARVGDGSLVVRWTPMDPSGHSLTQHFTARVEP